GHVGLLRFGSMVRWSPSVRILPPVAAFLVTVLGLGLAGCQPAEAPEVPETSDAGSTERRPEALRAEIRDWRADREARLREADGWLSLVGLEWLEPGRNLVGSHPAADVQFPEKAPETVGWIEWREGMLTFEPAPEATVRLEGDPVVEEVELTTDAEGAPTELAAGSLRFYVIDRAGDLAVRIKDRESPLLAEFEGIDSYPVDLSWRIEGRFDAVENEVEIPDILGRETVQRSPGRVIFEHGGREHELVALEGGADGSLFLVFGDETNGEETYGGGRFLYTEPPEGGRVVLDFNRAYNPPCVFTPYATCPLPPPQNRLPFPVTAGEKMWGAPHE
ncbi:MAG: DUF1684 domain-containing protein, partial [Thermoanaerobaculia bacterium]|nr:DUF1684 domain-containing protein [Thermoanaerobaculia bacterium]